MSLTNLGELKAAIADWATKTGLDAQMADFVGWAHQEICRRLRAPVLHARASVALTGETLTAPDGFLAAKRLHLETTPRVVLQQTSSERLADITAQFGLAIRPSYFAVEEPAVLAFAPLFAGPVNAQILYYRAPAPLAADADTNVVLAKYPFLYLFGALEALFRYLEDDNNADRYGAQFAALLASINAEEAKDALRGPLAGSPGAVVV
jgi:hypothetical protein